MKLISTLLAGFSVALDVVAGKRSWLLTPIISNEHTLIDPNLQTRSHVQVVRFRRSSLSRAQRPNHLIQRSSLVDANHSLGEFPHRVTPR